MVKLLAKTSDLFGFQIDIWQYTNYSWDDNKYANATANVTIIAYINTSAIGVMGAEVINFTATGRLYAYSTQATQPSIEQVYVSRNITFDGLPHTVNVTYTKANSSGSAFQASSKIDIGILKDDSGDCKNVTLSLQNMTLKEITRYATKLKHIGPGQWVFVGRDPDGTAMIIMYVYPNPIASGDKIVRVTFTRQ